MAQHDDGTPRLFAMLMEYDTLEKPLEIARLDAQHDLIGIPEVPYALFRDKILPSLESKVTDLEAKIDLVYQACIDAKVIVDDHFALFTQGPAKTKKDSKKDPGNTKKVTEDTIYADVQPLWEKVVEIAEEKLQLYPTIMFNHTPHAHPFMERGEAVRPDALSVLIESKMPDNEKFSDKSAYYFCNAAIIKEDKIFDKDRFENLSKILLNCNIVYANDPLRRGLYALTSEDRNLRVWFFCRSGAIVSEPLDWIKDLREFIGLIIRLSFATPTELGFDESMWRYWIPTKKEGRVEIFDKNLQYRIMIGNKRFRTQGLPLSDRRANFFVGHGTRIWAAIETDTQWSDIAKGIPHIALKVTWPKVGSKLEGCVIRELRKKAEADGDDASWLPVILIDGIVQISDSESEKVDDKTSRFVRMELDPQLCEFYPGPTYAKERRKGTNDIQGSARLQSTGGILVAPRLDSVTGISSNDYVNPNIEDFIRIYWVKRVQYRIAFDGIGDTVDQLPTMYEIFFTLRNGIGLMRKLHKYGYIHRDMNLQNLSVFRENGWVLQLNDYEFVRAIDKFDDAEQILTGTRQFMAIEILMKNYRHFNSNNPTGKINKSSADFIAEAQNLSAKKRTYKFHSNALHDLEPFFWMALWFLFHRVPSSPTKPMSAIELSAQLDMGFNIFHDGSKQKRGQPSALRTECLSAGGEILAKALMVIPVEFQEVELHKCVIQLAQHVVQCYSVMEGTPNFNGAHTPELLTQPPDWVYDGYEKIFDIYLGKLLGKQIRVFDATRPPVTTV